MATNFGQNLGLFDRVVLRNRLQYCYSDSKMFNVNFLSTSYASLIQVALLWQRDRTTHLSVEILQLQNIPIIWHYLRDPTFSRFYTIPECDRYTHTQTDGMYCVSITSRGKNRPYCMRYTKYNYYAGNERRLIADC